MDRRTFLALAGAGTALGATELMGARGAIPPAAAVPPQETATVPLQVLNIEGVGRKIGIEIRLGGGEPRLYTFDTGSSGFYAANNRDWWPSSKRIGGPQIAQTYGSHETFQSKRVRTSVGIPTTTGEIEVEADVGQILDGYGGSLGPRNRSPWRKDVAAGTPPLFGHFFGDFGSGLREVNGLFAILPQLPGNLSSGFAVQLGCGGIPSSSPTLEIGLTDAIRSEVTSWIPMAGGPKSPPFPGSGLPTYSQELLAGHYSLNGGETGYAFDTDAILDTGCATTFIHEHGDLRVPDALLGPDRGRLRDDVLFWVTAEGTEFGNGYHLEFPAGNLPGNNQVLVDPTNEKAFVNLGLIPYFRSTVVFDVERGLVGFGPCT
jgi:hypothetical protein